MNDILGKTRLLSHLTVAAAALAAAAYAGCGGFGGPGLPSPERWILGVGAALEALVVVHMWRRWKREQRSSGGLRGAWDDA
jgi:hypothetical protein